MKIEIRSIHPLVWAFGIILGLANFHLWATMPYSICFKLGYAFATFGLTLFGFVFELWRLGFDGRLKL